VGAGLAGASTAVALGRRGYSVAIVDPNPTFPSLFRAEKIEPDQADLLRSLELFDDVAPGTWPIREIVHGRGGKVLYRRPIEQFGISYKDIVNRVRAQYPQSVHAIVGRVESVQGSAKQSEAILVDGRRLQAKLLVLSDGMGTSLVASLGAERRMLKSDLSLAFGFMLERLDSKAFDFDAVTYRPLTVRDSVGYLTLFRMGSSMRGNLFVYWPPSAQPTRDFMREPSSALLRLLPGLDAVIGSFAVSGKVQPFKIDLYRMENLGIPGVVAIGDAYQSVCPSTGTGLSKVLTDVDVLCNSFAPNWLSMESISATEIEKFYVNPRKAAKDAYSMRHALSGRASVVDGSLHWTVRRWIRHLRFATGW
jgi:2-polyprenyl-6-methoxyphenol hydroxylase-like FAD-dependent oxidoreductase